MLLSDDFVGVRDSREMLQNNYCKRCILKGKTPMMVFARNHVNR